MLLYLSVRMRVTGRLLATLTVAPLIAGCGARSDLLEQENAAPAPGSGGSVLGSDGSALGSGGSVLDAAPDAPPVHDASFPSRQNFCIGFGLGEPVVGHPRPALPLLCGLDCSHGEPCPVDARCYAVYAPELRGTWVVSDQVVGYQCGPLDRACDAHEMGERYCRWCDSDQECQ